MARQAIQRALLVVALIGLAHTLKPISARSLVDHFLQTTRSLSFILPESAVQGVEQANYLAAVLGHGPRREAAPQAPTEDPAASVEADLLAWQEPTSRRSQPAPRASAKRRVIVKSQPRGEPSGVVACSLGTPASPSLPVGLGIEKAIALNLPAIEAAILPVQSDVLARPARAPQPPKVVGCESRRLKQIKAMLISEETQQKWRVSLQHLIESACSNKTVNVKLPNPLLKAVGFNLKCS